MHLTNRIVTHPGRDLAEWTRTRTLIEALHADRSPAEPDAKWLDARTRHLLLAAIRHLPERERTLAECELAVLDYHDRQLPRLARIRRWMMGTQVASVILGFVLLWLGLDWSGVAAMTAVILACYGVEAYALIHAYATARGIWHAYSASGGTLFWPEQ